MWIMIELSLKIRTGPFFNEILVKFKYLCPILLVTFTLISNLATDYTHKSDYMDRALVGMIANQNIFDIYFTFFILRHKAVVCQG